MSTTAIKIFNRAVIPEKCDAEYEAQFHGADAAETLLVPASISVITATLKTLAGAVINSRDSQNVKGSTGSPVNGGVLAVDGTFTLMLGSVDNIVTDQTKVTEEHILTLHVEYTRVGGGAGVLNREIRIFVKNLQHIS